MTRKILSVFFMLLLVIAAPSIVRAEGEVCEIVGGTSYTTLQGALDVVETGQTIKLLGHINHSSGISISGKHITFELSSFTLSVTNDKGVALEVYSDGIVALDSTGGGAFNVIGSTYGVYAHDGGQATVTNSTSIDTDSYGVYAFKNGNITVNENATSNGQYGHAVHSEQYGTVRVKGNAIGTNSSSFAVYAYNYGTVTVDGNAAGIYVGAYDKYYGSITVGGDATGSYCGVWANNNGAVTVYGNAAGTGSSAASRGVCAENNSKVIIYGDASGVDTGVYAEESNIEVYGNSIATSTFSGYGVRGVSFSTITIGGNVQGRDGGIHSFESVVSVEGNVQSQMCGIYATYAEVKVKGSVSSSVTGVKVGAGKVWVDGSISAPTYIDVNSVIKIAADGEISGNYYKYNSNMAYAYVKIPPAIKGISTDSSTILSIGGNILVTLSGINMPDNVVVSAFYGETVKLTGYAIGDSSSKTVNLSFPAVEAGTIEDMSYIIKASLDGGISWAAVTATVVERHAPIPVTAITVTSESDAITLLTGNSLQMTAVINPVDADFTGVIWSVQPVSGSATITDTGVLTGTAEGTITVTATAIDGTGINSKLTINVLTKPVLSGTVAILGAAKYGETLTADITGITYTPATGADVFKYQWKRNGIIISGATSETYTLVLADIDKTITLTIMADGINAIGSVSASTTVQRADGPPAPEPPTLNVKTHNSVTLNTISGMNYKKEGDSYWYVSSYFYGLLPNKTYAFTTRIGQTQTHYSSVASAPLYVTTDPAPFHTVTYYPNDGAETPTIERSVQEGTTFVTESSDSFIAPLEMLFKQWNTKPDGSGIGYSAGATVNMLNGDFSLHAIWEAATYTVIYCANGGTGTAPVQANMIKGATFQSAASDSFTAPIEKQFKEWNTQADGSGDYYAAEVTVTMPSGGLTLHAIWEKIQYPVTYYGNGGTGMAPIEANKAKDDIFQAATSDSFTPPVEKQFKKWNTQSNGGGISYMAGANVTMPSGGLNLYAIWEVATYPITYYANNGTEATLSGSKRAAGQTFQTAASDSFAAPVEKRFKEWNIQADGGGTSYAAGVDVITPSGGQKLYAIWEVVTYSVTYHANNWSYATITGSSLAKGATFTAEVNTFTAPFEKRFKEWNTKSDGSGTGYLAGTIVTMSSENLDLHAIWEIITHTVEYNGNENTEGSTPVDGNKYVYYSNFTISAPGDLVKSGHSLICWNTELDGTGADYWVGLTYQMSTTDLILYAKWTPYVSGDFTDVNFKQAIWEWLGNPIGSTPGDFTQYDLKKRVPYKPYCELYVDGKGIASLAGLEHFNDTMLKSFSCSNNPLTSLPTLPEGLEGLSCGNNQLTSLPTLPDGLQDLYCNNNQLTSLPALPDGLKSLSCDNNQLTSLPTLPDSLDTLICNNTQLTSLPALPGSLQYLFCDDNQLANLPTLPSSLQYLRCYGNQLTSLPTLPSSLKYLYCYGNLLTGLPVLPSGLSQLVCSNNYMDVFSDPLKTMIDNCSASDKNIFPQYRYMSRKDKIDMITSNSYSFADELYMLYINATESSNWEGEIYDITQFDFSSSDTNIVTINQDGVLTAIGDGSCTITALYHGVNSKFTKVELNVTAYSVYSFAYDTNGGLGTVPEVINRKAGDTFEAIENSFLPPEGKRFKEWNTDAGGTGTSYMPGEMVTMPAGEMTLYAIWELIPTYKVTYVGNGNTGGSAPVDSSTYVQDDYVNISDSGSLTRSGYLLRSWNTKSDGTGDSYGSEFYNSLIIGSTDVILYAQWERNISNNFTDGNFKQAVWEWLGNPEGSTPGDFSEGDLDRASLMFGYLDISNRGIANLNGFEYFQNTDLRFFNCGGNQITNMPDLPTNLEILACNDNKLIALPTLPDSLMGLASSNNQLFSLPALPAGLEILICSNNWLGNLPTLPEQLTTLICSNNQLAFLPILPESLAEIDFSFNYIQDVSRPDIVKISEDESNIIVVYPQYKLAGRQKELQLNSGDAYSLVNELYILQYDGTDWIETETAVDPSWIRFSSSDQAAAMTNDKGIITGFGSGTCQINALCGNNDTEYTKVTFTMTIFPREGGTEDSKETFPLTLEQVAAAIEKAEEGEDTVVCVEIMLSPSTDVNSVEIFMPKAAASLLAESKADTFMVSTPAFSITFSHSAIATISKEAMGEIKITASRVEASTLSDEVKQAVGGRQVYQFSVTSAGKTISQFGGKVTVSVPYTPKAGEDLGAIIIYYIDAEGDLEIIANCAYNSVTGMVTFQTNHFSYFAVGYNKLVFKDVTASAWYSKAVNFVAARGITEGIGNGKFDPNAKITRGQFVVMVMRAYGLAPEENPLNNFADAGDTYYTGYLAAAKRLGISGGVGNNMYAPEKEITRQDMFTLLYNTLKLVDELPIDTAGKALKDYNDADQIATWARTAMTLFVKTGIINGNEGNLNPTDTTSRAQMVQVLYNLLSK